MRVSRYLARLSTKRHSESHEPYLAIVAVEFSGGNEAWLDYLNRKPYLGVLGFVECADENELKALCAAHPDYKLMVEPCGSLYGLLIGRAQLPAWMITGYQHPYSLPEFTERYPFGEGELGEWRVEKVIELYDRLAASGLELDPPAHDDDWSCVCSSISYALKSAWAPSLGTVALHGKDQDALFERLLDLGYSVDEAIDAFTALGFIRENTLDNVHIPGIKDRTSISNRHIAFDYLPTVLLARLDDSFMDKDKATALIAREAETSYALAMMFAAVSGKCYLKDKGMTAFASCMPELAGNIAQHLELIYPLPQHEALFAFDAIASGYLTLDRLPLFACALDACMDAVEHGVPVEDVFK